MNEKEAIEQLQGEYLATNGAETPARVRYHNEALDTAIAALNEVQEYHATGRTPSMVRGLIGGYNRARKQCQEATSQLKQYEEIGTPEQCWEAVEHTRWIPVSERLPENERECLVTLKKTYGMQEVIYGIANYLNFGDTWHWNEKKYGYLEWDKYSDGYGGTKAYRVIAWLPLPEPYHITNPDKKEAHNGEKSGE